MFGGIARNYLFCGFVFIEVVFCFNHQKATCPSPLGLERERGGYKIKTKIIMRVNKKINFQDKPWNKEYFQIEIERICKKKQSIHVGSKRGKIFV